MKRRVISTVVVLLSLCGLLYFAQDFLIEERNQPQPVPDKTEENERPVTSDEPQATNTYPVPTYAWKEDEIDVVIEGLEKEYRIAFVNDVHMITDHKSGDVTEDNLPIVMERYASMVTPEGIPAEDTWQDVIRYLNYHNFDAVIFAGDLIDYCSNSNINRLNAGMRELKYPKERMMYLRSDHDYGGWYGGDGFTDETGFTLQSYVLDGDRSTKVIELEDFVILGWNQSYRNLSESVYEDMQHWLRGDKPVIFATHVPFCSEVDDSLAECSMEVRNRIYYWSADSTSYVPEEWTQKLIDEMYAEDSQVEQIVAAHLHAEWDGNVSENLKEHIFAPVFQGNIGIIHVTGGEKTENEEIQTELEAK